MNRPVRRPVDTIRGKRGVRRLLDPGSDCPFDLRGGRANAPPPACGGARAAPASVSPSEKKRGEMERPKTLVRIRRTRWPASRSSPSPESSAGDDRPYGAGAPSGAPSRRFHCCVGPRFAWMVRFSFGPGAGCPFVRDASAMTFRAGPPSVSRLPAGGCSASGRSPDAARARAVRQHARGRRTSRCGFPHRPPEQRRESPRPPPACSTLKTPHESAPLAEQGEGIIRADS